MYKTKVFTLKTEFKNEVNKSILEKYGGAEHLETPPRELIFSQTENYVEYSRHGKVVKVGEVGPTYGEQLPI